MCVCVHMFLFFFHSLLADCVFGPGKETKELFDVLGKPILDKVINGVNGEGVCVCICATMFVYVCMCVCMHHWQQWSGYSYSNSCVYRYQTCSSCLCCPCPLPKSIPYTNSFCHMACYILLLLANRQVIYFQVTFRMLLTILHVQHAQKISLPVCLPNLSLCIANWE